MSGRTSARLKTDEQKRETFAQDTRAGPHPHPNLTDSQVICACLDGKSNAGAPLRSNQGPIESNPGVLLVLDSISDD